MELPADRKSDRTIGVAADRTGSSFRWFCFSATWPASLALVETLVGNTPPLCMLYSRQPCAVQPSARTEARRSLGARSPSCGAGGLVRRAINQGAGFNQSAS